MARVGAFLKRFAAWLALARGRRFAGQLLGARHIPQRRAAVGALDRVRFARQPLELAAQTLRQCDRARDAGVVHLGATQRGRVIQVLAGGDGGHGNN